MALWLTTRIFWMACCAIVSYALPITDENDLVLYLKKIGYFDKTSNLERFAIRAKEAISTAIMNFRKSTGLSETGEQDNDTIAMMNVPLYGVKNSTERSTRKKRNLPGICQNSRFDAITRTKNGTVFAFQGNHYWILNDDDVGEGYPREITEDWASLEGNLDAAFTLPNGDTYFFKRHMCWKFSNKAKYEHYPKTIADAFEETLPDDINAAFFSKKDNKGYIFKGSELWEYEHGADPPGNLDYTKQIRGWKGLQLDSIDAVIQWSENITYFFSDQNYYVYNIDPCQRSNISEAHSISKKWFGC